MRMSIKGEVRSRFGDNVHRLLMPREPRSLTDRRRRKRTRTPPPQAEVLSGVGARLREARIACGISQAKLGAPYFTRAHVSAIELGKVSPALKSLAHFARKL